MNRKGRVALLPALFLLALSAPAQPPKPKPPAASKPEPEISEALVAKSQRARELMSAGRFDEAIPICQALVAALPSNPGLRMNLALAQHMAGRDRDAAPNLEAVLKVQPKNVPALVTLGAARLALSEPKLAISPFERALAGAEPATTALAAAARAASAVESHRTPRGEDLKTLGIDPEQFRRLL